MFIVVTPQTPLVMRFATPDTLLTQLRHISYAAGVPVSISDSTADVWKKLVIHAPEALDKVLTDGTLTKTSLQGQSGVSVDPRLTLAHLSHSIDRSRQQWPLTALPSAPMPAIPSPRTGRGTISHTSPATHWGSTTHPGVIFEGIVHAADATINLDLPAQRAATLPSVSSKPRSRKNLDNHADGTDSAPSDTVLPTNPTAILGHMIASCGRLDLEMREVPGLMDESAAKGVESARLECLRTHVAGSRVAQQHFQLEQCKLEKKIRELGHELNGLKILYAKRSKEVTRLRFLLAKEEMEDIAEDVVMGLMVNQSKGFDRKLNAIQR